MSAARRKSDGVVYTPDFIVDLILDHALPREKEALADAAICDPACGDGAFLTAVARRALTGLARGQALNVLKRMAGFDIDELALAQCRAKLDAVLESFYPNERVNWRLAKRDALERKAFLADYEGFTHIVGNPPYVRVQHLEQSRRAKIAGQWQLLRGATDLFIIFFELALDLLAEGGFVGYITPSSWLRSDSGSLLRRQLVESHQVSKVIDFGHHQMFDDVTTYTSITLIRKGGKHRDIPAATYDGQKIHSGGAVILDDANPASPWWVARRAADRQRMQRLKQDAVALGEIADIHVGIQTLADRVFILPKGKALALQFEPWLMKDITKASVMKDGRDPVQRMIIFPYDSEGRLYEEERIADCAPNIYRWLLAHKGALRQRDKGKSCATRWYAFGRNVSILAGFGEKLLTSGMNRHPNFQRCPNPAATFYGGYCIKPRYAVDWDVLLDLLNSEAMDFFIRLTSRPYQGGWMSYAKSFIEKFPVREADLFTRTQTTLFQ